MASSLVSLSQQKSLLGVGCVRRMWRFELPVECSRPGLSSDSFPSGNTSEESDPILFFTFPQEEYLNARGVVQEILSRQEEKEVKDAGEKRGKLLGFQQSLVHRLYRKQLQYHEDTLHMVGKELAPRICRNGTRKTEREGKTEREED